jgi:hypothetical protein
VVGGKGDQPRLACQHLDLDLGLTGEKPGEGNVDIAGKDVVDSAQKESRRPSVSSVRPAGVSSTRRLVRSSNATPSCCSSRRI